MIEFTGGFATTASDASIQDSDLEKIGNILNMFANYANDSQVTNLAEWKVNSEATKATETTSNNVIQPDLTADNVNGNWSAPSEDQTKSHNGVAWKKDSSSSNSQVVITGTANIYRSKFTSGSNTTQYQTFFGYDSSDNTKPKAVQIKITVNKTSSVR